MKLFGSQTSPYVRKVRILAEEKSLALEFVAAGPTDPRVTKLNPLGKIPVLERDNGAALFDSWVIAEFLDSLANPPLVPASGEARWAVQRWHALAQGIMDAAVTHLMENRRPADKQLTEALAKQAVKIDAAIAYAEQHLGTGPFLVGTQLTLADIALGAALEYADLRYTRAWRERHPRLAAWLAPLSQRPSFKHTAPPVGA